MYGIGFNHAAMPGPAFTGAALPAPGFGAAAYGGGFSVPAFHDMAPMQPERFINTHSGGVLLDKAGSPTARIPEGSFVDAKEGKLHGPDGKAIAVPEGGSFDLFDMPDVAELVSGYKAGVAAFDAMKAGGGKAMPMQQYPITAVDGQWGPGGVIALKGGGKPGMSGCGDHGATQVGGAAGSGMPVATKGGGPLHGLPPAQMMAQLTQLLNQMTAPGTTGMVAGVNGGGSLDAMSGAGSLGGMPGLQQSLQELVRTLRQLTMALQGTQAGGPATQAAPPKVDTKPATETTAPATTTTATTAAAGASGSGTGASTSASDSSTSTSTGSTSTSTSTST